MKLKPTKEIKISDIILGGANPFVLIAGPCVMESEKNCLEAASFLKDLTKSLNIPFIFKSSFDKANRTSIRSYRGPGLKEGLVILERVKKHICVPVLSDVHEPQQAQPCAEVLDVLQIPAFLCRQTDLIIACANTGKPVNIKKGQFLAPWDVKNIIEKVKEAGNVNVSITERGTSFGYNNLVVDFTSLPLLREMGQPVVFDATHSVQLPGGAGTASSGRREFAPYLARAAAACGVDGIFMEVHADPEKALSDGATMIRLSDLEPLLIELKTIDSFVKKGSS